jgi:transcriptional regulator with XRE-family HTH domain
MEAPKRKKTMLFKGAASALEKMGENVRLARLRRGWSQEQLAKRANTTRKTVEKIEAGIPAVGMGYYIAVIDIMKGTEDIAKVLLIDEVGRKLDDLRLNEKERVRS